MAKEKPQAAPAAPAAPTPTLEAPVALVVDETATEVTAPVAPIPQPWAATAPAPFPEEALASNVQAPAEDETEELAETKTENEAPVVDTAPAEAEVAAPVVDNTKFMVIIPHNFTLTVAHGTELHFAKGVGKMTEDELNHWWTIANGVTRYED